MAPEPIWQISSGHRNEDCSLPSNKHDGVMIVIIIILGLQRGGWRCGHEASFLPCVAVCAAGALCEQVWAAGWRGPRKKKALWRLFMLQEATACLKTKQKWQEKKGRSCCWLCGLVDCWLWSFTGGSRYSVRYCADSSGTSGPEKLPLTKPGVKWVPAAPNTQ